MAEAGKVVAMSKRREALKKISGSTISGGGINLRDGRGRLVVKRLALETGFKGLRFVAEFVVLASQKIPVVEVKTGKALDVEPNAPNTDVSIVNMIEKHESAVGNVKALVLAVFNSNEEETPAEELDEVLDEVTLRNSAAGMVVDFETYRRVTTEKQVEIVLPKWYGVEQSDADIAKMRKWLEALRMGPQAG